MTKTHLLNALNANNNDYYESSGKYPSRVHLLHKFSNKVQVPSKKHKNIYNTCEVVFSHLYEQKEKENELYWLKMANHSSVVIGHKCIEDIYENLLISPTILIEDQNNHKIEAKIILLGDVPQIVRYIHAINKTMITLGDVDYNPNR